MDASEELAGATHVGAYRLVRRLFQVVEGVDTLKEGLLARRVVSPHILNPLRSYVGLWRNMARILSGSRPDMKRRRRRELWCSVPRSVSVNVVNVYLLLDGVYNFGPVKMLANHCLRSIHSCMKYILVVPI